MQFQATCSDGGRILFTIPSGDDYRYRFEPEAKQRFLDLLRERFNSGVTYKGRALKWDTVIEQKTLELGHYLVRRSDGIDFSDPCPKLERTDGRELRRDIEAFSVGGAQTRNRQDHLELPKRRKAQSERSFITHASVRS